MASLGALEEEVEAHGALLAARPRAAVQPEDEAQAAPGAPRQRLFSGSVTGIEMGGPGLSSIVPDDTLAAIRANDAAAGQEAREVVESAKLGVLEAGFGLARGARREAYALTHRVQRFDPASGLYYSEAADPGLDPTQSDTEHLPTDSWFDGLMKEVEFEAGRQILHFQVARRVNAEQTTMASQMIQGLVTPLTAGITGGLAGGPAGVITGPTAAGVGFEEEAYQRARLFEGMSAEDAEDFALAEGRVMAAGFALPASVTIRAANPLVRIGGRAAVGALINTAVGAPYRYGMSQWLEQQGYADLAKQYKWNDPVALGTDVALGALFGAWHHGPWARYGGAGEAGAGRTDAAPRLPTDGTGWVAAAEQFGTDGDFTEALAHAWVAKDFGAEEADALIAKLSEETGVDMAAAEARSEELSAALLAQSLRDDPDMRAALAAQMDEQARMSDGIGADAQSARALAEARETAGRQAASDEEISAPLSDGAEVASHARASSADEQAVFERVRAQLIEDGLPEIAARLRESGAGGDPDGEVLLSRRAPETQAAENARVARGELMFPLEAFHGTRASKEWLKRFGGLPFRRFNTWSHFGTRKSAEDRLRGTRGSRLRDQKDVIVPVRIDPGQILDIKADSGVAHEPWMFIAALEAKGYFTLEELAFINEPLEAKKAFRESGGTGEFLFEDYDPRDIAAERAAEVLDRRGVKAIRYTNAIEDVGSVSYVVPHPKNIRHVDANFDPASRDSTNLMASTGSDGRPGQSAETLRSILSRKLGTDWGLLESASRVALVNSFDDLPADVQAHVLRAAGIEVDPFYEWPKADELLAAHEMLAEVSSYHETALQDAEIAQDAEIQSQLASGKTMANVRAQRYIDKRAAERNTAISDLEETVARLEQEYEEWLRARGRAGGAVALASNPGRTEGGLKVSEHPREGYFEDVHGKTYAGNIKFDLPLQDGGNGVITATRRGDRLQIHGASVSPEMRGKGHGVRLYEAVLDWARENGFRTVLSDVEISADAKRIYDSLKRRGYSVTRRVTGKDADTDSGGIASRSNRAVYAINLSRTAEDGAPRPPSSSEGEGDTLASLSRQELLPMTTGPGGGIWRDTTRFGFDLGNGKHGEIHARVERGAIYVEGSDVPPSLQQQGLGTRMYATLLDWAAQKGLRAVFSDTVLSQGGYRVYGKLKAAGYRVTRNARSVSIDLSDPEVVFPAGSRDNRPIFRVAAELAHDDGVALASRTLADLRNAQGFHLRDQKKTYLLANNIAPERAMGVLLHEVGWHHGIKDFLGPRLYGEVNKALDQMHAANHPIVMEAYRLAEAGALRPEQLIEERGAYTAEEAETRAASPVGEAAVARAELMAATGKAAPDGKLANKADAVLAHLIEAAPDLPLVKKILAAIRQWLWKTFGADFGQRLSVEDIRALAIASLRKVAREPVETIGAAPRDAGGEVYTAARAQGYEGSDTGEAAEWLRAKAKGLPMDEASRMARAQAMGFDTTPSPVRLASDSTWMRPEAGLRMRSEADYEAALTGQTLPPSRHGAPLYHGMRNDIQGATLRPSKRPGLPEPTGVSLTPSPNIAGDFGNIVVPVLVRGKIGDATEFMRRARERMADGMTEAEASAQTQQEFVAEGFTGARFDKREVTVFDPRDIRSKFAAFDPDFADEANLMASIQEGLPLFSMGDGQKPQNVLGVDDERNAGSAGRGNRVLDQGTGGSAEDGQTARSGDDARARDDYDADGRGGAYRPGHGDLPLAPDSGWRRQSPKPPEARSGRKEYFDHVELSAAEIAERKALIGPLLGETAPMAEILDSGETREYYHPLEGFKQSAEPQHMELRRYYLEAPTLAHRSWDKAFDPDATYLSFEVGPDWAMLHEAHTSKALRGAGVGAQLHKDALDSLIQSGRRVFSDASMSDDAMRVWREVLPRLGYKVISTGAKVERSAITGQLNTVDHRAHFEVRARPNAPSMDVIAAKEAYHKLDPVEQVLADTPDLKVPGRDGEAVPARDALEQAQAGIDEAADMAKAANVAVRCALRHGDGA